MTLALTGLVALACQDQSEPTTPSLSPLAPSDEAAALLDPALEDALADADAADELEVIVNFDETLTTTAALTDAVLDLGAGVIQFRHLSMLAALAHRLRR